MNIDLSFVFELDRHKSIYHQPSLTKYNPSSEKRRKRRHRSQPSGESFEERSKSLASNGTNESSEIGNTDIHQAKSPPLINSENPSARIQFLLGDEDQDDDDEEHKPHDLFIELSELISEKEKANESGEFIEQGWKETARFVTFSC